MTKTIFKNKKVAVSEIFEKKSQKPDSLVSSLDKSLSEKITKLKKSDKFTKVLEAMSEAEASLRPIFLVKKGKKIDVISGLPQILAAKELELEALDVIYITEDQVSEAQVYLNKWEIDRKRILEAEYQSQWDSIPLLHLA
tara:strand:- start:3720 stop:4139 length:420 start_codon:yes stop_codon:yes gene_type:complete